MQWWDYARHLGTKYGPLILIVALAAYLRLSNLDLLAFKLDQATAFLLSANMLDHGTLPLVGMGSSVGTDNPPLFTYLMAIPLLVRRDPAILSAFVALLNLAGLVLAYFFVRRYLGSATATIAVLLYAVNPWSVVYSRDIWAQSLLPPLGIIFFWYVASLIIDRRPAALIGALVSLSVLVQLHLSAVSYIVLLIVLCVALRAPILLRNLVVGTVCALILWAPFLYFEASQGFPNTQRLLSTNGDPALMDLSSLDHALSIATSGIYTEVTGRSFAQWMASIPDLRWVDSMLIVVLLAALLYAAVLVVRQWRATPDNRRQAVYFILLLLWFIVPVLFFARHSRPVYRHYLTLLHPVQFILIATLLDAFRRSTSKVFSRALSTMVAKALVPTLVMLFLGVIVGSQLFLFNRFYAMVASNVDTAYGIPLRFHQQVVDRAVRLAHSGRIFLLADGDIPTQAANATIYAALRPPMMDLTVVDGAHAIVKSTSGTAPPLYILAPDAEPSRPLLEKYAVEVHEAEIRLPGSPQSFRFFHNLPANSPAFAKPRFETSFQLANGVRLVGYDTSDRVLPGQTLTVTVYWSVPGKGKEDFAFFNHVVDDGGRQLAGADGLAYPIRSWREGDIVASWYDLPVPSSASPGRYWLETGMYTQPALDRVNVFDSKGKLVGDYVRLQSVKVLPTSVSEPKPIIPLQARLGEIVEIAGYDASPSMANPSAIRLYWRLLQKTPVDYRISLQAIDLSGRLAAQTDRPQGGQQYPTSIWDVGETVTDDFALPDLSQPGTHRLQACVYDPTTMQRLKVHATAGVSVADDCVVLQQVSVGQP